MRPWIALALAIWAPAAIAQSNASVSVFAGPGIDGSEGGAVRMANHSADGNGAFALGIGLRRTDEVGDEIGSYDANYESYDELECENWHNRCSTIVKGKNGPEVFVDLSWLTDFDQDWPASLKIDLGGGFFIQNIGRVKRGVTEYQYIQDDVAYYIDSAHAKRFGLHPIIGVAGEVNRLLWGVLWHGRLGLTARTGWRFGPGG